MKPFQKRALAAGLIAIAALLVGFQSVTTVLTIAEYGAKPKPSETRVVSLQADRRALDTVRPVKPEPGPAVAVAPAELETTLAVEAATPNPSGVAAAAREKALAEIEAMDANELREQAPPPRRSYRPNTDKHRVY